jgi:hypothetical protein
MIYPFGYSWTATKAPRWTSSRVEAVPNKIAINCPSWVSKQRFLAHVVENGLLRVLHRASSGIVYFRLTDVFFSGTVRQNVIIWRIFCTSQEVLEEKLLEILPLGNTSFGIPFIPIPFGCCIIIAKESKLPPWRKWLALLCNYQPPERLLELWCEWCSRKCRLSIVQGACWHVMDGVVLIANKSNSTDLCWNDNICLWNVQIMYYPITRLRGGRHWLWW